jgi:oligopeptide transport system permease protein
MAVVAAPRSDQEFASSTVVREQASLWRDGLRRLRRNRLALISAVYLILLAIVALVALVWTPYPTAAIGVAPIYSGPSGAHLLGADELGRDLLSRLMAGAQISLAVGLLSAAIVLGIGVVVGLTAGYFRGWVDGVISTVINIFYGIPALLVALLMVTVLGRSFTNVVIAISATVWMDVARLVRGQTLSLREREYVEAARASGARSGKILFGHILPNALGPIIVAVTFVIPSAILFEAFLSYLGVGIPPPTPTWGAIASEGVQALRLSPHILLFPSIALSLTLLAFNFLGDGLRDAFDPRQKR